MANTSFLFSATVLAPLHGKLGEWLATQDRDALVTQLLESGVPSAKVADSGDLFDNPQLRSRGFIETVNRAYIGEFEIMTMPFRFSSRDGGWALRPASTLGQPTRKS